VLTDLLAPAYGSIPAYGGRYLVGQNGDVEAQPSAEDVQLALGRTIAGVQAACKAGDTEYVRTAALNILATLETLRDKPDVPLQEWRSDVPKAARAALWLVDSSANSLLEQLNTEKPDWDGIGAAAIFAQSGVEQLRDDLAEAD